MSDPLIHLSKTFSPDQVLSRWVDFPIHLPPPVQSAIEAAWSAARLRLGDRLYDGPLARLHAWRVQDGALHLEFTPTGYKHFLGTNLANPHLADQYGPEILANPLGISALLETSDHHLILGRRGAAVAFHTHRVHPLGGTIERPDADVFAEILRELNEEADLTPADIHSLLCVGLAEDPAIRQPELMFHAKLKLPLASIRLYPAEHDELWSIPADKTIVQRAMLQKQLTPIATASLNLWYSQAH